MPSLREVFLSKNLVLNIFNMDPQINLFVSQWKEEFPGVATPDLNFEGMEDVERSLASCKTAIKNLEEKLKQERFHLIFLQVSC